MADPNPFDTPSADPNPFDTPSAEANPFDAPPSPPNPQLDPEVVAQHEEAARFALQSKFPKLAEDLYNRKIEFERYDDAVRRAQYLGQPTPPRPAPPPSYSETLAQQPNDPWYTAAPAAVWEFVKSIGAPVKQVAHMVENPHRVPVKDRNFQTEVLANQMLREKRLNAIPGAETAAGFGEAVLPVAASAVMPPLAPAAFGVGFGLPHTARLMNEGVDPGQAVARGTAVGAINALVPGALRAAEPVMAAAPALAKPLVGAAEGFGIGVANNLADAAAQAPFDPEGAAKTATNLHSPVALAAAGGLFPAANAGVRGVRDRIQAVRDVIREREQAAQSAAAEQRFREQFPEVARSMEQPVTRQTGEAMAQELGQTMLPYTAGELGVAGDIPGMRTSPEIGVRKPIALTPEQLAAHGEIAVRAAPGEPRAFTGLEPEPGPVDPTTGVPRLVQPELPALPEPAVRVPGGEPLPPPDRSTPASRARMDTPVPEAPSAEPEIHTPGQRADARKAAFVKSQMANRQARDVFALEQAKRTAPPAPELPPPPDHMATLRDMRPDETASVAYVDEQGRIQRATAIGVEDAGVRVMDDAGADFVVTPERVKQVEVNREEPSPGNDPGTTPARETAPVAEPPRSPLPREAAPAAPAEPPTQKGVASRGQEDQGRQGQTAPLLTEKPAAETPPPARPEPAPPRSEPTPPRSEPASTRPEPAPVRPELANIRLRPDEGRIPSKVSLDPEDRVALDRDGLAADGSRFVTVQTPDGKFAVLSTTGRADGPLLERATRLGRPFNKNQQMANVKRDGGWDTQVFDTREAAEAQRLKWTSAFPTRKTRLAKASVDPAGNIQARATEAFDPRAEDLGLFKDALSTGDITSIESHLDVMKDEGTGPGSTFAKALDMAKKEGIQVAERFEQALVHRVKADVVQQAQKEGRVLNRHVLDVVESPEVRAFMDEPTEASATAALRKVSAKLTELDQTIAEGKPGTPGYDQAQKAEQNLGRIMDQILRNISESRANRPDARRGSFILPELVADAIRGASKETIDAARNVAAGTKALWDMRKELADAIVHGSQRRNPRFNLGPKGEINLSTPEDIANWRLKTYLLPATVAERFGGPGADMPRINAVREENAARVLEDGATLAKPLLDLSAGAYKKVNEVLRAQDLAGRDFTDAELTSRGLDQKQVDAVHATRAALDYWYNENKAAEWYRFNREAGDQAALAQDVANRKGQTPATPEERAQWARDEVLLERLEELDAQKRQGYLPRSRSGNYAVVHVQDTAGKSTYYARAENANHLADIIADVKARGLHLDPATDVVKVSRLDKGVWDKFSGLDGLTGSQLQRLADAGVADAAALVGNRRVAKFLRPRAESEVPGYGNDSRKLLNEYGATVARRRANAQWRMESQAVLKKLEEPGLPENTTNFWREHIADMNRPVTVWDRANNAIRSAVFLRYLGFSVPSAVANLSQLMTVVGPTLAYHTGRDAGTALNLAASAIRQVSKLNSLEHLARASDPALRDAILKARKGGALAEWNGTAAGEMRSAAGGLREGARGSEVTGHVAEKGLSGFTKAAGFFFAQSEKMVRAASFVAGFKAATKGGVDFWRRAENDGFRGAQTPEAYANWLTDKTNYKYGASNRPGIAKLPVAGPILAGLQQYTLATSQLMISRLQQAYKPSNLTTRDRAAATASLAKMGLAGAALGGVMQALPGSMMWEAVANLFGFGDLDDPMREKVSRAIAKATGSKTAGKLAREGVLGAIPTEEGSVLDKVASIAQRGGYANFGIQLKPERSWEMFPFTSGVADTYRDLKSATHATSTGEAVYSSLRAVAPALATVAKVFGATAPESRGEQTKGGAQIAAPGETAWPRIFDALLGQGVQEKRRAEAPRVAKVVAQGVDEERRRFVVRLADAVMGGKADEASRIVNSQLAEDEKTGSRFDRRVITPMLELELKAEVMKRLAPEQSWMRSMSPGERVRFLQVQALRQALEEDSAEPIPGQ